MARLLIVDDELPILESIGMFMAEKGHGVRTASNLNQAMVAFEAHHPELVILDIRLPDGCGLETLKRMKAVDPLVKVIMITAFQDMETTIEAMKCGAYDYLHKPLDAHELDRAVTGALSSVQVSENVCDGGPRCGADEIVGRSRAMKDIFKMIGILCQNRATALITGETGTGKELVARRIHLSSGACHRPFVVFDCSAVVDTLMESELFGHEKGAFTGAVSQRRGKIEQAGEGTLFLDEIGELPLKLQGKLLGFLERKQYMRVGGEELHAARCRVIAATNRDLETMVREKRFRDDLYFRLRVVNLHLPPLKDRLSDLDALVPHFLEKASLDLAGRVPVMQKGAMAHLRAHHWPGNVRELENLILSAAIRSRGDVILRETIVDLLSAVDGEGREDSSEFSLAGAESRHIERVLKMEKWNRTRAAKALMISLPTLRKKIQKYKISP